MQTMYYKTSHFIQHSGNIVDLGEYRSRMAAVQQDTLARKPEEEKPFLQLVVLPTPEQARQARRSRRTWALDACASLSVIVMTLLFILRVML